VNDLTLQRQFDRIVSVEMFEHVRNYEQLFARLAQWLRPDGKIFVHIFVHGSMPYTFETEGDDNWMGKYFFTGGIMPSDDLFYHFQGALTIKRHWRVNGRHYERTALDWLRRQDENKDAIMGIFRRAYGAAEAGRWFHRWRIFFLACAGLWGYNEGREWWVSHYLFEHATVSPAATPSRADRQPESRESSPRR
jgi:cyclopropane-fatty-acyl-phospholipid synthase